MQKKTIILLIMIAVVGIVGLTIAYFTNTTSISNLFSTNPYGTTVTEVFESPDNWLPGTTTPKTIEVTNSGLVDEAVRISYAEIWVAKDGTVLSGLIDKDGNLTDEEENSEHAAIINFSNNNDWTYSNGYYYYNYKLAPNEKTSTLIDSVTFNSKVKNSSNCTTTENNGTKTITCNSTNSGYDGATYTLIFKIETVQYNKYKEAWGVDVAILEEQALFCDAFEVGEVVTYNNAEYYVLKDSSTSDDYVTLLKKDPLTANEVNQYSDSYVSQDGEYPYFESDTCNENNQTGCSTNYDTSAVKKILDGWSSSFSDDLKEVDGYKISLLSNDYFFGSSADTSGVYYYYSSDVPNFIKLLEKESWTSYVVEDLNTNVFSYGLRSPKSREIYNKLNIQPIINLKKSSINGECYNNKDNEYLYCRFGEEVVYNNDKYYVVEESDNNQKYVTLLKKDTLTAEEVNAYSTNYISIDGEYPYYESDTCNENNQSGCIISYENSDIKKIVDGRSSSFSENLVEIYNNYEASLIGWYEIYDIFRLRYGDYPNLGPSKETPTWVFIDNPYWGTKTGVNNKNYSIFTTTSSIYNYNKLYVRPMIKLKKSVIEKGCSRGNNKSYEIGEIISYNNDDFCVIESSNNYYDYVSLIKQEPLTYDELVTYNNGYEIGRDNEDNNIGTMSYYKSDTCYYNSDNDKNYDGCSKDYNKSNIKYVVDKWSESFNDDLKEIDGYKSRLITFDELINIGYYKKTVVTSYYIETDSDTRCLPESSSKYWYIFGITNDIISENKAPILSSIRPVINLKKCAITNSCE